MALTLLALAKVEGHSIIQSRYRQKNAWYIVAEHGTGMRLVAMFFGLHASDVQTARLSVFSHCFKRLERFPKLATSSEVEDAVIAEQQRLKQRQHAVLLAGW